MSAPQALFLGGTGVISAGCSALLVERGVELHVLVRGRTDLRPLPPAAAVHRADALDPAQVRAALGDAESDAVVDGVAFTTDHVRDDVELFRGRTGQFVFLSSVSAHQTPHRDPPRGPVTDPVGGLDGSSGEAAALRLPAAR